MASATHQHHATVLLSSADTSTYNTPRLARHASRRLNVRKQNASRGKFRQKRLKGATCTGAEDPIEPPIAFAAEHHVEGEQKCTGGAVVELDGAAKGVCAVEEYA